MSEFNGRDERDDWEDPQYEHDYCTVCDMCRSWEGRTYEDIRAEHNAKLAERTKGTA
jgi:hypothetical protein